ncbi:unnamed protein product [Malus baccata var. baccata]
MDSSLREPTRISSREKRLRRVILPAIRGQNCPICLVAVEARSAAVLSSCNHAYCVRCIRKWSNLRRKCPLCNADFDSWFSQISLSSRSFHKELLPPLNRTCLNFVTFSFLSTGFVKFAIPSSNFAILCIIRHVRSSERRRSRPLPWRRSFGRPGSVGPDMVAERKLQWRASVYDRRLQAVPSASRNRLQVSVPITDGVKERILQRIEPWIRRELRALLGDGDPSIIVHVATSLFIASLENKDRVLPGQCDVRGDPLASLRPFLVDRTDMFLHELRCFAESPFNMETYDAVVESSRAAHESGYHQWLDVPGSFSCNTLCPQQVKNLQIQESTISSKRHGKHRNGFDRMRMLPPADVPDFVLYILHTTHGSGGSLYQVTCRLSDDPLLYFHIWLCWVAQIMVKSNTRVLHQQPSKAQKKG